MAVRQRTRPWGLSYTNHKIAECSANRERTRTRRVSSGFRGGFIFDVRTFFSRFESTFYYFFFFLPIFDDVASVPALAFDNADRRYRAFGNVILYRENNRFRSDGSPPPPIDRRNKILIQPIVWSTGETSVVSIQTAGASSSVLLS